MELTTSPAYNCHVCFLCCDRYKKLNNTVNLDETHENRILLLETLSKHFKLPKDSLLSAAQEFQESESLYCRTCAKWCHRILTGARVNTAYLERRILRLQVDILTKLRRLDEASRRVEEGVDGIKATLDSTAHLKTFSPTWTRQASRLAQEEESDRIPIPRRVWKLRQLFLNRPSIQKTSTKSDPLFITNDQKEAESISQVAPGFPANFLVTSDDLNNYSRSQKPPENRNTGANISTIPQDNAQQDLPTPVILKEEPLDYDDYDEEPDDFSQTQENSNDDYSNLHEDSSQTLNADAKTVLSFNLNSLKALSTSNDALSDNSDTEMTGDDSSFDATNLTQDSPQPNPTATRPKRNAAKRKQPSNFSDSSADTNSDSDFEMPEHNTKQAAVKPQRKGKPKPKPQTKASLSNLRQLRHQQKLKEYDFHMGTLQPSEESPEILTWNGVNVIAKNGTLQCGLCGETKVPPHLQDKRGRSHFCVTRQIRDHIYKTHLNGIPCPICEAQGTPKRISTYSYFIFHLNQHKSTGHLCPICQKPFKNLRKGGHYQWHLWTHKNTHEQQSAIQEGTVPPPRPRSIQTYRRKVPGQAEFLCSTCGKDLASNAALQHHQLMHMDKEERNKTKIPCPQCGKMYFPTSLKLHTRSFHKRIIPVKRFPCEFPDCGRNFISNSILARHIVTTHTKEYQFNCDVCGKAFATKSGLNGHASAHSDVKAFQCPFCSNSYKKSSNLRRHERTSHKGQVHPETGVLIA